MLRFCLILLMGATTVHAGNTLHIAAAANLAHVIEPLTAAFKSEHSEIKTQVTLGSSGSHVAQITHGAPFDIFLSADMDYPRTLIQSGHALAKTLTPFADGCLVLWTTNPDIQITEPETALQNPHVRHIALANPDTAPYGRAGREVIKNLKLPSELNDKLVIGENVSQAAHFIASGNAELGFVALSLVLAPQFKERGQWIEIPSTLHTPITQGAVVTTHGSRKVVSSDFLVFLQSPTARKIFARFGYRLPALP